MPREKRSVDGSNRVGSILEEPETEHREKDGSASASAGNRRAEARRRSPELPAQTLLPAAVSATIWLSYDALASNPTRKSDDKLPSARAQFTTIDESRGHRVVKSLLNPIAMEIGGDNTVYFCLFHLPPAATVPEEVDHIHHYEHQVIVPAVSFLTPETGMPEEDC